MPSETGNPEGTTELRYYGYVDPYLVHALKRRPQNAVVEDRRWLRVEGIGETGLKLPIEVEEDEKIDIETGDTVTVSLWNGRFLCQPGPTHTNRDLQLDDQTPSPQSTIHP